MEPGLAAAYARCRELHRRHGRTYYLATRLLPAWKRPHVHALYGFTRYADEIVDRTEAVPLEERTRQLAAWSDRFLAGLNGEAVDDPLLPAVLHTINTFGLEIDDFVSFLKSMAMDLEVTQYANYAELLSYMEGSAAVIGTMMLPILGPTDLARAREPARQLGLAFQLTNFIRDIAEDLDRGRIYLPHDDMELFGVSRADLRESASRRAASPPVRALVEYVVRRARAHYVAAAPGVLALPARSQVCIRTAYHLYASILDEIEKAGYDVFGSRVVVPTRRRLGVVARCLLTSPVAAASHYAARRRA